MFTKILKIYIGLCLVAHLASGATKNATTTTTTTTPKPLVVDQVPSDTVHYDSTLQLLRHGESLSNSKSVSYSKSAGQPDYEANPHGYQKARYVEEQLIQYGTKDTIPNEGYYKGGNDGGSYQQHQPPHKDSYSGSYEEDQYQQREPSYQEPPQKGAAYTFQEQGHYGNQEQQNVDHYGNGDYPKGGGQQQYESADGGKSYNEQSQPPYLQYAYEVSHDRGQPVAQYEQPSSGDESGEKSGYGPIGQQGPEYYPVHKPESYANQNIYKGHKYEPEEPKHGNYFPTIPTEAGYVSNNQKEPVYLQSPPPSAPSAYPEQAGYLSKSPEPPKALIPFLPEDSIKEPAKSYAEEGGYPHEPQAFQPVLSNSKQHSGYPGRVPIIIKHLGHKSSDGTKGRHGFLLLPVVHGKVQERLKQLGGGYGEEYKQQVAYKKDQDSGSYLNQRPVIEKEIYVQPKDAGYSTGTTETGSSYGANNYKGTEYAVANNHKGTEYAVANNNKGTEYPDANNHRGTEYTVANNHRGSEYVVANKDTEYAVANNNKGTEYAITNNHRGTEYAVANNHKGTEYTVANNHKGTEYVAPQVKSVPRPQIYVSSKPASSHTAYVPLRYESLKVLSYGGGRPSSKEEVLYSAKSVSGYKGPEAKSALLYAGNHGNGATSHVSAPAKYGPVKSHQAYNPSPYDATTAHRSPSVKILQPSLYASLARQSAPHPQINIAQKVVVPSHVLSAQYKSYGTRLSPTYQYPKVLETTPSRSYGVSLQKSKGQDIVGLRPNPHTARGRVSAKGLVEGFGLHDYEALLAKQKAPSIGKLYYDLHEFPVRHDYTEVRSDKSYSAITPVVH